MQNQDSTTSLAHSKNANKAGHQEARLGELSALQDALIAEHLSAKEAADLALEILDELLELASDWDRQIVEVVAIRQRQAA